MNADQLALLRRIAATPNGIIGLSKLTPLEERHLSRLEVLRFVDIGSAGASITKRGRAAVPQGTPCGSDATNAAPAPSPAIPSKTGATGKAASSPSPSAPTASRSTPPQPSADGLTFVDDLPLASNYHGGRKSFLEPFLAVLQANVGKWTVVYKAETFKAASNRAAFARKTVVRRGWSIELAARDCEIFARWINGTTA